MIDLRVWNIWWIVLTLIVTNMKSCANGYHGTVTVKLTEERLPDVAPFQRWLYWIASLVVTAVATLPRNIRNTKSRSTSSSTSSTTTTRKPHKYHGGFHQYYKLEAIFCDMLRSSHLIHWTIICMKVVRELSNMEKQRIPDKDGSCRGLWTSLLSLVYVFAQSNNMSRSVCSQHFVGTWWSAYLVSRVVLWKRKKLLISTVQKWFVYFVCFNEALFYIFLVRGQRKWEREREYTQLLLS